MMTDNHAVLKYRQAVSCLPERIQNILINAVPDSFQAQAQEIRLRIGQPVMLITAKRQYFLDSHTGVSETMAADCPVAAACDITEAFKAVCGYSVHSRQNEIRNGFVTIRGGHRVGICGTAVYENGILATIRDISSLNIRIAKEIRNLSLPFLSRCCQDGICSSIIGGEPGSGKTTLLRDIAYQLSSGYHGQYIQVCLVDERGELAAMHQGQAQNRFGPSCDILDGFSKPEGIMAAVRTLTPQVILFDELGGDGETEAVETGLNSGVKFITSIHAGSMEEMLHKPQCKRLMETGAFSYLVQLGGRNCPGVIREVKKIG